MPSITLRVKCYPTEDPLKVKKALLNIFPESVVEECEDGFIARAASAERFMEIIRNQRILDSARGVLRRGMSRDRTTFTLSKQVAFVGKVSFIEDRSPPLGGIEVVIEDDNLEERIDTIAPRTVGGEEV